MTTFISGSLAKTEAAIKAAALKIAAVTPTAEHSGAEIVAREMAARAPVAEGKLRASIHASGSDAVADVPYAIPVDRGHGNASPQPFAEAGAKAATHQVEAAMIAVFRTALGGK